VQVTTERILTVNIQGAELKTKLLGVDMTLVQKAMQETGCSEQHAIELVASGNYPAKQEEKPCRQASTKENSTK
jgi:hypothetical protein